MRTAKPKPQGERVTQGFSIDEEGTDQAPKPRRPVRTREQIMKGEGKRPPAAVALSVLAHNPYNPRDALTDLEETAATLREKGQLQPVAVVRRTAFLAVHADKEAEIGAAEYVVIDGNRRLAAAALAELAELRIDVNDSLAASAEDMLESALIANVHRVDVPPLDQAKAIQELLGKHGSQEKVAKRLGKSAAWVSQRLALLGLPEDLQEKVESGELKVKDGRRIGRLPADEQHSEAAAALNRVKAPRKPRSKAGAPSGSAPKTPIPPQASSAATSTDQPTPGLNPVKTGGHEIVAPDLPWADPKWFNETLRAHMSAECREELVLLLMADS